MLPFSRAGTNIYLTPLQLEMKSIPIFIYFYSSWVCGCTLWLHRNQQFLSLLHFLLIFPLIYLCDTLISCLEYYNCLSPAWAFSSHIFLLAFSSLNPWCFLFSVPAFEWPFLILPSIPLSSQPLLVMVNIEQKTLQRLFITLFTQMSTSDYFLWIWVAALTLAKL